MAAAYNINQRRSISIAKWRNGVKPTAAYRQAAAITAASSKRKQNALNMMAYKHGIM